MYSFSPEHGNLNVSIFAAVLSFSGLLYRNSFGPTFSPYLKRPTITFIFKPSKTA